MLRALKVPLTWTEILKRTAVEVMADNCLGLAAQLAYYFFLALFPALLFLVAVISFMPVSGLLEAITTMLARVAPGEVLSIVESSLRAGSAQVAAIRVDWAKWKTFFRGMQGNPLLERIFAAVEDQDSAGVVRDWRNKIEFAAPAEKETVIAHAVREVVGSVLRVKPDTLRDDQPLTDLGLDSLMGVEIENSLEAAIGVALPPTSLMRARTIGQIAALIAGHVGGTAPATATTPANGSMPVAQPATSTVEVDLDALSTEEIGRLLGDDEPLLEVTPNV